MPRIKPFCALKPAVHLQSSVVTRPLENYSMGEAKLIASENDYTFLHLINPELDHQYLKGTRQELIFKKISENVEHFIEDEILVKEKRPAVYVYKAYNDGLVQKGIWTLTHINDYLEGNIRKHESTVQRREQLLADYLQQTGLDANPVLITYHPDEVIDVLIDRYIETQSPCLDFTYSDGTKHEVWAIVDQHDLEQIVTAFAAIPVVYIADGHHRIASMAKMGLQKRALNSRHHGQEEYNYFTSVYMNTREVKVLEFNRLVRDLGGLGPEEYMHRLRESFDVEESEVLVKPKELHEMGMYFNGEWYILRPKKEVYDAIDPVGILDVSILQEVILEPLLGIKDPRTDARITFEGGKVAIDLLQQKVDNGLYALAFTLYPPSIEQVMSVADANGVMPPKSTWVEPKFLVGLLTSYFN